MAAAHYAIFSCPVPSASAADSRNLVLTSSSNSVSISPSPKSRRRKNYLRPKLLKTLNKPFYTPLLHQEPNQSPTLPFNSEVLETTSDGTSGEDGGEAALFVEQETTSLVAGDPGVSNASGVGLSTASVLKFACWGVGIFVLQTVCAVWMMESVDSDKKYRSLESENGRNRRKNLVGIDGLMNEPELVEKIGQIRAMARAVREREERELQSDNSGSYLDDFEENDDTAVGKVSRVRSGIGKDVDERLIKLQKSLNSIREKSFPELEDGKRADISQVKKRNGVQLIFEKKLRFRNLPVDPRSKPKGFQNPESHSNTKNSNSGDSNPMAIFGRADNSSLDMLDQEKQLDMPLEEVNKENPLKKDPKALLVDGRKLQDEKERTDVSEGRGFQNAEPSFDPPKISHGKPSIEVVKSKSSNQVKTQKARSFTRGKRDYRNVSNKSVGFGSSSRLKSKGIKGKSAIAKVMDKPSDISADPWWLNLPYVLAIYMRRGSDSEGPGGLYTSRSTQDHSESSYTIAFEDRGDATNFCYILETFFEDLGDVSVDTIPLTINELKETLDSHTLKVVVVKKGQIQLYAGQPLVDVEEALRSLMEQ